MFEDVSHDGSLGAELLKHLLRRDVLSGLGLFRLLHNLHLAEKHFSHLLRRGDVKLMSGELVDVSLYLLHAFGEHLGRFGKGFGVQTHARGLHFGKHRHQRHLYIVEQLLHTSFLKTRLQHVVEAQRDVGILSGIVTDGGRGEVAHAILTFSLRSDKLVDVDSLIIEQSFGKDVHVVLLLGLQHIVGNHRVEHGR